MPNPGWRLKGMKFIWAKQTARTASAHLLSSDKKEDRRPDGACSEDGYVQGSYLHGLFSEDNFRRAFMASLGAPISTLSFEKTIDDVLDQLAEHIEQQLDVDAILACAR